MPPAPGDAGRRSEWTVIQLAIIICVVVLSIYGLKSMLNDYLVIPIWGSITGLIQGLGLQAWSSSQASAGGKDTVVSWRKPLGFLPEAQYVAFAAHRAGTMIHDDHQALGSLFPQNITRIAVDLETLAMDIARFEQQPGTEWPLGLVSQLGSAHRLIQDLEGGAVSRKYDRTFAFITRRRSATQGLGYQRSVQNLLGKAINHRDDERQQLLSNTSNSANAQSIASSLHRSSCELLSGLDRCNDIWGSMKWYTGSTEPNQSGLQVLISLLRVICQSSNEMTANLHGRLTNIRSETKGLQGLLKQTAAVTDRAGDDRWGARVEQDLIAILRQFVNEILHLYFASDFDEAIEAAVRIK